MHQHINSTVTKIAVAFLLLSYVVSESLEKASNATIPRKNHKASSHKRQPKSLRVNRHLASDLQTSNGSKLNETHDGSDIDRLYYEPTNGSDEPRDGQEFATDFNFNLMNSSQDRIQAVKNLVNNPLLSGQNYTNRADDPTAGKSILDKDFNLI